MHSRFVPFPALDSSGRSGPFRSLGKVEVMSDELEARLEQLIGRVAKVLIIGIVAALGTIVGASVFITRVDMRLANVERTMPLVLEEQRKLTSTLSQVSFQVQQLPPEGLLLRIETLERLTRTLARSVKLLECVERGGTMTDCREVARDS